MTSQLKNQNLDNKGEDEDLSDYEDVYEPGSIEVYSSLIY